MSEIEMSVGGEQKLRPCKYCAANGYPNQMFFWEETGELKEDGTAKFKPMDLLPTGDSVPHRHRQSNRQGIQQQPKTQLNQWQPQQQKPQPHQQPSSSSKGKWVYRSIVTQPIPQFADSEGNTDNLVEIFLKDGYEPVILDNGSIQLAQHPEGSRIVLVKREWVETAGGISGNVNSNNRTISGGA